MKTRMNRLLMFALWVLAPGLTTQAESAAPMVRFLAERSPAGLGQVVMATKDARSEAFDLPTKYLSASNQAGARIFSLRTVLKDISLATVTLPDGGNSFVVLLIPAREGGYKPVVIRADDAKFKSGDVYFYNHSPAVIVGQVGTARFKVESAASLVFEPAGARNENFYDVSFFAVEEKGTRTLSKTRWPVDKKVRSYVFFFIHPENNRLDFRSVDEFIPLPAVAEAP